MTKEHLDDFHDSKNKTEIRASKQMSIEVLPPVLILHLKRFSFGLQGAEKVHKAVSYPLSLKIRPAWLASEKKYTAQQRTYSLVAVVSHLGQEVAGGHYTCDIRQANGQWLYFDDHRVTRSSPESVTNRKAYILVYQMSTYDDWCMYSVTTVYSKINANKRRPKVPCCSWKSSNTISFIVSPNNVQYH